MSRDFSFILCSPRNSEKCCHVSWCSSGSRPRRRSSFTSPSGSLVVTNISPRVREAELVPSDEVEHDVGVVLVAIAGSRLEQLAGHPQVHDKGKLAVGAGV